MLNVNKLKSDYINIDEQKGPIVRNT